MTKEQEQGGGHGERRIPDDIQERYRKWETLWWRSALYHYLFGILGAVCSATGAALVSDQPAFARVLSLVAVACFAIIGFVHPERRYSKFVRAWRVLDSAVRRFKRGVLEEGALDDAVEEGESIITEVERDTSWPRDRALDKVGAGNRDIQGAAKADAQGQGKGNVQAP